MKIEISRLSIVEGATQKGFDIQILSNPKNEYAKFEIYLNKNRIARTDTEDKARIYMAAFADGYEFALKNLKESDE